MPAYISLREVDSQNSPSTGDQRCAYVVEITRTLTLLEEMNRRIEKGDRRFDKIDAHLGVVERAVAENREFARNVTFGYKVAAVIMAVLGFAAMAFLTYLGVRK